MEQVGAVEFLTLQLLILASLVTLVVLIFLLWLELRRLRRQLYEILTSTRENAHALMAAIHEQAAMFLRLRPGEQPNRKSSRELD
jgi:hypothetical protein